MRVDFYLLSQGAADAVLARIAKSVKGAGERLLVVSDDAEQLAALDKALWEHFPEEFLAHGLARGSGEAHQPLLLASTCDAANGARHIAFADGLWRDEAFGFERAFLVFDNRTLDAARGTWRMLGDREDIERHFWKQEDGRWVEGP